MEIITQKFVPPFGETLPQGRERLLKAYNKKCGVYFIKENGVIVYIGMSTHCVVKALYRHFYSWQDCYRGMGREYRTTYAHLLETNNYEATIIETAEEQTHDLEKTLIIGLNPRDNREKYESYFSNMVEEAVNKQGLTLYKIEYKEESNEEEDDMPF